MLTDYIANVGISGCPNGAVMVTVPTIDELKAIPNPVDGMIVQVIKPILGDDPEVLTYVFNGLATVGISADDGTEGRWNVFVDTTTKDKYELIFDHYIEVGTVIDLNSLPSGTLDLGGNLNVFGDLDSSTQTYMLNDTEVGLTVVSPTSFTLEKALQKYSKLEFIKD